MPLWLRQAELESVELSLKRFSKDLSKFSGADVIKAVLGFAEVGQWLNLSKN